MIIESKLPVLVLSYRNCELHCCHLDGYKTDTEALLRRLSKIEAVLLSPAVPVRYRVWYNADQNRLDCAALKLIAQSIARLRPNLYKIAFIGLRGLSRFKFNRILKRTLGKNGMPFAHFSDAEAAKAWLAS